jgi:hypothetical protein
VVVTNYAVREAKDKHKDASVIKERKSAKQED